MWRLIKKEIRENYLYLSVFLGVLFVVSLYATFRKVWKPEEALFLSLVLAGIGGAVLIFYGIYRGFGSIKREKDKNTLEFLMSLPIGGFEVISSKFLAFSLEVIAGSALIYIFSILPPLRISFMKIMSWYDFVRLLRFVFLVNLGLVLGAMFVYVVFNLFEILNISLGIKGFFLSIVAFFLYIYLTFRLLSYFKSILGFIPEKVFEIGFLGQSLDFKADFNGLAAGALLSLLYLGVSIMLYNKKMEV
ncbi:MAG: hypothetical protein ACPLN0_07595 [Candidatus Hydrothermia bacterium]